MLLGVHTIFCTHFYAFKNIQKERERVMYVVRLNLSLPAKNRRGKGTTYFQSRRFITEGNWFKVFLQQQMRNCLWNGRYELVGVLCSWRIQKDILAQGPVHSRVADAETNSFFEQFSREMAFLEKIRQNWWF